jgi:hypothetical protein
MGLNFIQLAFGDQAPQSGEDRFQTDHFGFADDGLAERDLLIQGFEEIHEEAASPQGLGPCHLFDTLEESGSHVEFGFHAVCQVKTQDCFSGAGGEDFFHTNLLVESDKSSIILSAAEQFAVSNYLPD